MHRFAGLVMAALTATALTAGAHATDVGNKVIVGKTTVYYGDLKLSTAQGAAMLEARISTAAAMACGGAPQFATSYRDAPTYVRADFERCRKSAIHTAINDVRRQVVAVAY